MKSGNASGVTLVFWGGIGHAKVLRAIAKSKGDMVGALFDRNPAVRSPFPNVPCFHLWDDLVAWVKNHRQNPLGFALALGSISGHERIQLHERLIELGLEPRTLVHEWAWVAETATIGLGCQVLAMAAVGEEAVLGKQCIVNTNASIDHECVLGDGIHIMPGATLAGLVRVGDFVMIGSNATILPRLKIGVGAVVGAGAVVLNDVPPGVTVVGNPARQL